MNKDKLKLIAEILRELNKTLNDNHNDGGFDSAKTSGFWDVENKIKKLIK